MIILKKSINQSLPGWRFPRQINKTRRSSWFFEKGPETDRTDRQKMKSTSKRARTSSRDKSRWWIEVGRVWYRMWVKKRRVLPDAHKFPADTALRLRGASAKRQFRFTRSKIHKFFFHFVLIFFLLSVVFIFSPSALSWYTEPTFLRPAIFIKSSLSIWKRRQKNNNTFLPSIDK